MLNYLGQNAAVEKIAKLIRDGADVNAFDGDGRTVLMLASMKTGVDTAHLLIENQANVNETKKDRIPALMIASQYNSIDMDRLLKSTSAVLPNAISVVQMDECRDDAIDHIPLENLGGCSGDDRRKCDGLGTIIDEVIRMPINRVSYGAYADNARLCSNGHNDDDDDCNDDGGSADCKVNQNEISISTHSSPEREMKLTIEQEMRLKLEQEMKRKMKEREAQMEKKVRERIECEVEQERNRWQQKLIREQEQREEMEEEKLCAVCLEAEADCL